MKTAMISSTARDLPEHRKVVEHACRRMGFDPIVMEELVATSDADAVKASIEMVDRSNVFIGIYAYRYGYIPDGSTVSITELEFNRAKEKNIPRLVFLVHEDHPVKRSAIETGEAEKKLEVFKQRVGKEHIVRWFKSPQELSEEVFAALGKLVSDQAAAKRPKERAELFIEGARMLPLEPGKPQKILLSVRNRGKLAARISMWAVLTTAFCLRLSRGLWNTSKLIPIRGPTWRLMPRP
jgi:Domain of unknown function (DUF4062)